MFTGIVEAMGTVESIEDVEPSASSASQDEVKGRGKNLTIGSCAEILTDAHEGDSISVNGTCLTITSFTPSSFQVGVAPETLRRTNLGQLSRGGRVNLERAMHPTTRMGGHFVQGHVDTVAEIVRASADGEALTLRLRPRDPRVLRYIIEKGYVALDGASLTVTAVGKDGEGGEGGEGGGGWWEIMLIAYTRQRIITAAKQEGDSVNVEVDMVGKYVENCVKGYFEDAARGGPGALERLVDSMVGRRLAASK